MYSVRLGYSIAKKRIKLLAKNGHHAEALVTSVFTFEKTLRRTLRQLIVSAGFTSKQADKMISNLRGSEAIKDNWSVYDPQNRSIGNIVGNKNWQVFKEASEMRNKLIHGNQVYDLKKCKEKTNKVLAALDKVKEKFDNVYNYSGWTEFAKRYKHKLHIDPKVKARKSV